MEVIIVQLHIHTHTHTHTHTRFAPPPITDHVLFAKFNKPPVIALHWHSKVQVVVSI